MGIVLCFFLFITASTYIDFYSFILFVLFCFSRYRHQNADIDFKKYERTFQRIKKGSLPANPTTVAEIIAAFEKDSIMTSYGESLHVDKTYRFFDGAFEAPDHSFCVFSSKATIELVLEKMTPAERHILMDATFRIVPIGPFKQMLILYIRKNKQVSFHACMDKFLVIFVCLCLFFIFHCIFFFFQGFCFCIHSDDA